MDVLEQVRAMEVRLLTAMVSSNADELDRLISDEAIIVGPDGHLVSKSDDLAAHRDGILRILDIIPQEQIIHPIPGSVIVSVVMRLRGTYQGQTFGGLFRYTRTWYLENSGWRIITAHISPLPPSTDMDIGA